MIIFKQTQTAQLAELLRSKPLYRDVFDMYVTIGSGRQITIDEAIRDSGEERSQVIDFFKKCAEAGVGNYIIGRRTQPTRLELNMSDSQIKEAVKASKAMPGVTISIPSESTTDKFAEQDNVIKHTHLLRAGQKISIELPADFNSKDAERLKAWIDTIPFD